MRPTRALPLLLATVACGGGPPANAPPSAALAGPVEARTGERVLLDATGSSDADGHVVSYLFRFGDGSQPILTASPAVPHDFLAEGVWVVELTVADDRGATDMASLVITVRAPPACLSDEACPPDERCEDGRCVPTAECSEPEPCEAPLTCQDGRCRCAPGTARCGDLCVSLADDPAHCGRCDAPCASGTCVAGACAETCPEGWQRCGDGLCHDLATDPAHCGGCDRPCTDGAACVAGACQAACPDGEERCPDGLCAALDRDPAHCGSCTVRCEDGERCEGGTCQGAPCPPGEERCADGACHDLTSDVAHCGACDAPCPDGAGVCVESRCHAPGDVLDVRAAPDVPRVAGLTVVAGQFVLTTGERIVAFDPTTGATLFDWTIDDAATRRLIGLAAAGADGVLAGARGRWDPWGPADLRRYSVWTATYDAIGGLGGPMASDGATLWVYANDTRELLTIDAATLTLVERRAVTGLAPNQTFTDLALDGRGGLWAVRPATGPVSALMVKLDIASASVTASYPPVGAGGVVLHDGLLWAAGPAGLHRIVP